MIYKIVLDSYDTTSFTGAQYNATYYTNFNEFMLNPIHLNKAYKMYVEITSVSTYTAQSWFDPSVLYYYSVDFSKQGTHCYSYNNTRKDITGFLRFENNANVYTSSGGGTAYQTPLNIKVSDGPFYIDNLLNVSNITFQVFTANNNATFTPTTADGSKSYYTVILTFIPANDK